MKKTNETLLNEELNRFMSIGKYVINLREQEEELPVEDELELGDEELPAEGGESEEVEGLEGALGGDTEDTEMGEELPVEDETEIESDTEVETEDTEEVDVTDLVNGQKELEGKFKDTEDKISQSVEKVEGAFTKLDDLEAKIEDLNKLYGAIENLGNKIDNAKPKSPEEKLELRSLDSYPFNQKLTDFFDEKETEMEVTGKNEYVLTTDDVSSMSDKEVKDSFKVEDDIETE
jgi:hypothetical protein